MWGLLEREQRIGRLVMGGYLALCLGTPAFGGPGVTRIWDGGGDGTSWSGALNWDPNGVPGSMDDEI